MHACIPHLHTYTPYTYAYITLTHIPHMSCHTIPHAAATAAGGPIPHKSGTGFQSGIGKWVWNNDHAYEGEWLNGKQHGRGVYTWTDRQRP